VKLPHKAGESQFSNVWKNYHHRDPRGSQISQCLEKSVQEVPIFENFEVKVSNACKAILYGVPIMNNLKMRRVLATSMHRAAREIFQG
jgi:hypothetical protein